MRAKLSDDQVKAIRSRYPGEAEESLQYALDCLLAERFGWAPPEPPNVRRAAPRKDESELTRDGKAKRRQRAQRRRPD